MLNLYYIHIHGCLIHIHTQIQVYMGEKKVFFNAAIIVLDRVNSSISSSWMLERSEHTHFIAWNFLFHFCRLVIAGHGNKRTDEKNREHLSRRKITASNVNERVNDAVWLLWRNGNRTTESNQDSLNLSIYIRVFWCQFSYVKRSNACSAVKIID